MNTRIVTITKVSKNSITHNEGLSASPKWFPSAKVGQQWRLTTDDDGMYPLGEIKESVLIKEAD